MLPATQEQATVRSGGSGMKKWLIPVGVIAVLAAAFSLAPVKGLGAKIQSHNLLALLSNLTGTTDSMLLNTQQLHTKVLTVQNELGQLNKQEAIIQQQQQTGQELASQLAIQEKLTTEDVNLMGQILVRQKQSVQLTGDVAHKASSLSISVGKNANMMDQLLQALNQSGQTSNTMNQQMNQLLAELDQSMQEFKFFGQVDKLLSGLGLSPATKSGSTSQGGSSILPLSGLHLPIASTGSNSPKTTSGTSAASGTSGSGTSGSATSGSGTSSGALGSLGSLLHVLP